MGRNSLGLARDSLFIDKTKQIFAAADAKLLKRVYAFSRERAYADDEVPLEAAGLLLDQDADAVTVAAALLAPLLRRGLAGLEEARKHFGPDVAAALENIDFPAIFPVSAPRYNRDDIHGLLASMAGVPRNAVLLIAFRLLALEEAVGGEDAEVQRMAQETMNIYVPIADRLSLGEMRRRLEDSCFRILDPNGYERLKEEVSPIQADDDKCLRILLTGVERLLGSKGIQGRLQSRTKSLHAIRRKMTRTGKNLEEIMDRVGLRVIVASVPECYTVLGLLHTHFKPIPGTFDDYIGLPKNNGYQSLHTCVYPVREISHKPIEFQVRTELMHMEAEHGAAAHWRYKSEMESGKRAHNQAEWMAGLVRRHDETDSAQEFIELLHRQVFRDRVVVFGNGGRIVRLAENATVRDYLSTCDLAVSPGAVVKVNGKRAEMGHFLCDGDSIEIVGDGDRPAARAPGGGLSLTGTLSSHEEMRGTQKLCDGTLPKRR